MADTTPPSRAKFVAMIAVCVSGGVDRIVLCSALALGGFGPAIRQVTDRRR